MEGQWCDRSRILLEHLGWMSSLYSRSQTCCHLVISNILQELLHSVEVRARLLGKQCRFCKKYDRETNGWIRQFYADQEFDICIAYINWFIIRRCHIFSWWLQHQHIQLLIIPCNCSPWSLSSQPGRTLVLTATDGVFIFQANRIFGISLNFVFYWTLTAADLLFEYHIQLLIAEGI